MAVIIDGRALAKKVTAEVSAGVVAFRKQYGRSPGLHVVLSGDDPASQVYVRNKEKTASLAGFNSQVHRLESTVSQEYLEGLIRELNQDDQVDGILVQLPLFAHLQAERVLELIDPAKDVDGFHAVNVGKLWSGMAGLVPCTPRGCMRLLAEAGVVASGKRAIVIGRSNLVGKPVAALLLAQDATVTIAHSRTADLPQRCREADIVIAAVGRAKLVKKDWIKPGAAVLDVGMNEDENGKLCGDVDFAPVSEVAGVITKVPGGVGPMTIAMLMDNTLLAARARMAGAPASSP